MKNAYAFTLLRTALGLMWIAHALLKIVVFTLPGADQFFVAHGFPAHSVYPVVAAELIGGAMILLGFYGRVASLALVPVLLGALAVHVPNGWVFTASGGGWEYPAFLVVASLVHALGGDGAYALRRTEAAP
jgi:putative oxidoreductase